jgi:hypothetical protein
MSDFAISMDFACLEMNVCTPFQSEFEQLAQHTTTEIALLGKTESNNSPNLLLYTKT